MNLKQLFFTAVLGSQTILLAQNNAVQNGSFETSGGNGTPAQWDFRCNKNAAVTVTSAFPGYEGEKCLRIVSRLKKKQPHVFGLLSQMVKIRPNTEYLLQFAVRGSNVNNVSWALGKGWMIRYSISHVTEEWQERSFSFKLTPEQLEGANSCGLRLIVEGPCQELDIDHIRLTLKQNNIVINGSFDGKPGTLPPSWSFRTSGNAKAAATVDDSVKFAGKTSLRLVNQTPRNANVYGALSQTVKLSPNIDYAMRVRARGEGTGVNIAVGHKWLHRLNISGLTNEWQNYEFTFRLNADEVDSNGNAPLVIITENVTPGIWLDELVIVPREDRKLTETQWQENRVMLVGALNENFTTLQNIPVGVPIMKIPISTEHTSGAMPDAKDFSAESALLSDTHGLIFLARVTDNVARPGHGENMWKGDSIQIRFDRNALRYASATGSDLEVGFSVDESGKVHNWCWDAGQDPFAGKELSAGLVQSHGIRMPGSYFLAARLSWKLLGDLRHNKRFGFSIVINDSDSPSHRAVYFLTPGVHDAKYSNQYVQALLDTGTPVFWAEISEPQSTEELTGTILLSHVTGNVRFSVDFTDAAGRRERRDIETVFSVKPNELIRLPFSIPIDMLAPGPYQTVFLANGEKVGSINAVKTDFYKTQLESTGNLCKMLQYLKGSAKKLYGESPLSPYISVPLVILEKHLTLLHDRLLNAGSDDEKRHYARQAAMIRQDTEAALADLKKRIELLQSGGTLPGIWKFNTTPVSLQNGWPVATVSNEIGEKVRRPVIFCGYGHFNDIDRDIANFQLQGVNIVQVEIGPRALFPREGNSSEFEPDFSIVNSRLLPLMKKAYENNVKITLLISPHYHPAWLLKKYPELSSSSGFFKYEVTHPKAKEMLQAYIASLIGYLKTSPYADALHSLCISNEPVNTGCSPANLYSVKAFRKYMEKKYGPVAKFNAVASRNFRSYEDVADSTLNDIAARYEFYSFSRESFASWHRMLAKAIRKIWPEIPVHSKIMVFSSPFEYVSGIDPELMAEFSDYNGNDNYFYRRGRYLADWNVTAMTHEMQISAKPVSIANTENHIIPDREIRPVSNDHIYTAIFQQFITGASTLVTWVWANFDYNATVQNPRSDFIGNIRQRPGNIVAHALAGIDGLRLAPELRKFFDYKPEAAILYSPTSLICSPDMYRAQVTALYTQLCFTGYRVRFLSERHLARREFGNVKLLYAVGTKHISRESIAGLKCFLSAGGHIVADRESLTRDQFDNPLLQRLPTEPTVPFTPIHLLKQLHRYITPLPVSLAEVSDGIFFRAVPDENGNWLVNLVNYNFIPRDIVLEGHGNWFDLIGEQPVPAKLTLTPLKPQLLRYSPVQ